TLLPLFLLACVLLDVVAHRYLLSFPTRRSSDLPHVSAATRRVAPPKRAAHGGAPPGRACSSRRDERGDAVECSVDHIVGVVLVRDRKSTRLNSSHVSSSYAVLCLKKNKPRSRLV